MDDIYVWRSAHHYMKRYGDDALARARRRAGEMLGKGDSEGAHLWQRIADAIEKIERERPSDDFDPINR